MKTTSLIATLALGLSVSAAPSASLKGRQLVMSCSTRPHNGPLITNPDTIERFKEYAGSVAKATDASVPKGYKFVDAFVGLEAAAIHSSYMASLGPEGYKPEQCAEACNLIEGCQSFNIFFERVPLIVDPITLAPNPSVCPGKVDSPSATLIRCAFYTDVVQPADATNVGQWFGEFPAAIAGSSAFQRSGDGASASLRDFLGPVDFGNQAIETSGPDYLRIEQFGDPSPTPEYNPFLCAISCASQVAADGRPECVFFNAYIEHTNFEKAVFVCAYYSKEHSLDQATNKGQIDGDGNVHTITSSFGYSLQSQYRAGQVNSTSTAQAKSTASA
ncbi:hypothetical protein B0T18DRAFT_424916 [Schizothecium vesticola]|uniref:Uncharacterized protein n=1 Tax=Schizothecium vesticola TaxID=314040 RepID=A0AA40KCW2_9PEZI|nr:hypothetical protein B0T18DRAFT_424916 [Schizothecium vesticola]